MREKLIELFEQEYNRCEDTLCSDCKYDADKDCGLHALVDHLIAHGVTIQTADKPTAVDYNLSPTEKWIPVTERLPEKEGVYQVWTKTPFGGFKSFNKASFYCGEWHGHGGRWTNVTHWMPLPEPPKGE